MPVTISYLHFKIVIDKLTKKNYFSPAVVAQVNNQLLEIILVRFEQKVNNLLTL